MQRFFSFIAGTMCGAAFGAVAALLLAPVSGRDLKAQSRARVEQIAAQVRQAYEDKQLELRMELEALKDRQPSPT
jgi:gas vesicle protein